MTTNEELIERAAIALYETERADSEVGQHWISWEALIEKDREHPDRGEKWGAGKYRRLATAALAAVSDTTPSEPGDDQRVLVAVDAFMRSQGESEDGPQLVHKNMIAAAMAEQDEPTEKAVA